MTSEAQFDSTPAGLVRSTAGWFAVNLRDIAWFRNENFGAACQFDGAHPFEQIGLNVRVLKPGQPNCMYHRESAEENFFVLQGECVLLVEGKERPLRQWDFAHTPPETNHVLIGAGDAPCVILMVGTRDPNQTICYPVEALARARGAGVDVETSDPKIAYADAGPRVPISAPAVCTPDGAS
jgi:uncharacterized cupin superfamily protein